MRGTLTLTPRLVTRLVARLVTRQVVGLAAAVLLAGCGEAESAPSAVDRPSSSTPSATPSPTIQPARPAPRLAGAPTTTLPKGFPLDVGLEVPDGMVLGGPARSVEPLPNDIDVCGHWVAWPPQDPTTDRLMVRLRTDDWSLVDQLTHHERDLFLFRTLDQAVDAMNTLVDKVADCRSRGQARWAPVTTDTGFHSTTATLASKGDAATSTFQATRVGNAVFMVFQGGAVEDVAGQVSDVTAATRAVAREVCVVTKAVEPGC